MSFEAYAAGGGRIATTLLSDEAWTQGTGFTGGAWELVAPERGTRPRRRCCSRSRRRPRPC